MRRTLSRRSFLAAIVGAGAAALGAAEPAEAQRRRRTQRMVVDSDPKDLAEAEEIARSRRGAQLGRRGGGHGGQRRWIVCPGSPRCPR
jgi:hypothetical protein